MTEVLFVVILFVMAFAAALGAWLALIGTAHMANRRGVGYLHYLFYVTVFALAVSTAVSGRNFATPDVLQVVEVRHPLAIWSSRLTSIFLLLATFERLIHRVYAKQPLSGEGRTPLIVAFIVYWVTTVALPSVLGSRPSMSHEYAYSLVIGLGVLLMSRDEAAKATVVARNALIIFMAVSLLMIPVRPELVLDRNYVGLVPGLPFRFVGLGTHANMMGPYAVAALMCLWAFPMRLRWLNTLSWALVLCVLLLCQSKTSWGSLLVCSVCMGVLRRWPDIRRLTATQRSPALAMTIVGLMLVTLSVAIFLMFNDGSSRIERMFHSRAGGDLLTLSGRDQIWDAALREWQHNRLFGYGPTAWGLEHRFQLGMPFATHAHNQFLNTLSNAGAVGVLGLSFYFLLLMCMSFKLAAASGGLSVAIFVLIFLRSMTEVPLTILGYGTEQLIQFLLLIVLVGNLRQASGAGARTAGTVGRFAPSNLR